MIAKDERGHCFHDWHGSWKNARVMAFPRREAALPPFSGDGFLRKRDCSGRLECNAKINVLAVADPALHAAGVVGRGSNFTAAHFERVIMLRAAHPCRRKPGADLESLTSRYAQHRFRQVCFKLVENRLAESRRNTTCHALDNASN